MASAPLLVALSLVAQFSPWWEHYDTRETFQCPRLGRVTLERNDAQASLIAGGVRSTGFRDDSGLTGIRYRNEQITLILKGDLLTIEQRPTRIECTRTEQV